MTDPASPRARGDRTHELTGYRKPAAAGVTKRLCLRCRQIFPSEGAHNRMCGPCREGARRSDPNLPDATVSR